MALKLHTLNSTNLNALKILIAAEYAGVEIKVTEGFQMGVSNKTPEFLKLNPIGKIPVLETPEGAIFESNAIARHVARLNPAAGLYGKTLLDAALVDQWLDFSSNEILGSMIRWVGPRFGMSVYTAKGEEMAVADTKRALGALNTYLASATYLVGDAVTLADIVVVTGFVQAVRSGIGKQLLSEFPHVERYYRTGLNQPAFKKILGEGEVEASPLPPSPAEGQIAPRFNAYQPTATSKEVPTAVHEEVKVAPKAAPKPVGKPAPKPAGKPAPKPAGPAPGAEEEEEAAPKPKPKNALDLLPPSSMVLDNWKRLYSNTKAKDFAEVAIKGFWEMYDPEGYSLWFCAFKFNEENTVNFVTMNKVAGWLQRMDLVRKYAFGKIAILGEKPPYKIKGVWLFWGTDFPQLVKDECYDTELYEWTKVDIADEDQKARVNAYFEEPDEIDGEKLLEAKCFK
eukprot:TRINITY_DN2089_c0_g1_i8.p1 TRINITY_DN2089_c0_g1~~TRINITY_DN2089_c0_g1_i8.p1  ORF type:complete len:471 (-),score=115.59 TRINITY_DN2089_c0_g1_i8:800-2161(-)